MIASQIYSFNKDISIQSNMLTLLDERDYTRYLVLLIEHKEMQTKKSNYGKVKTYYTIEVHELVGQDEFGPIIEMKHYEAFTSKAKAKAAYKVFSY